MDPMTCLIILGIIALVIYIFEYKRKTKTHNNQYGHQNYNHHNNNYTGFTNSGTPVITPTATTQISQPEALPERFPYYCNNSLLTNKEKSFYKTLKPIADKYGLTVFTKIRIADIVSIPRNTEIKWFNYIKAKHIDFVLCDNETKPLILIEVDDRTHDRADRQERDEFVNQIFRQTQTPLLHYRTWTVEEIDRNINHVMYRISPAQN